MILDILVLIFFVIILNWNIGLYNLVLEEKGRSKYILLSLNILVSLIIGMLALFY